MPPENEVVMETVHIGEGKEVVHVRVPARGSDEKGPAWEALFAPKAAQPLFAGRTGFSAGDPGERTGVAVQIVPSAEASYVLVGDLREDLRLCGQETTLLHPRALYPASMTLRPATVQRLNADQLEHAQSLETTDQGTVLQPPMAKLLVARGSSVDDALGTELTDGDPKTVWRELRPGAGQGEFVVMASPREVPIARMAIELAPKAGPSASVSAPRTFYLVTNDATFEVTLPDEAARKPGEAYQVVFPVPIRSSCVAVVLGSAFAAAGAHPDVGLAEIAAYSEFDTPGATLEDVAKRLSGERAVAAAQVLERSDRNVLNAVTAAYDALDGRGRALAVDVAASLPNCADAAPLLVRALCEGAGEAARKAREKLERCPPATPTLARVVRTDSRARACVAPLLALMAPAEALEPIADAMATTLEVERETRAVLRRAFGEALQAAPAERLKALLGDSRRPAAARLEMLRAAGERAADAAQQSEALLSEIFESAPPLRSRYLALDPLGVLARAGDAVAAAKITALLTRDADWPVRAHAAEVSRGIPSAQRALANAVGDWEPRVREAALATLASQTSLPPEAGPLAVAALKQDQWPFVRTAAIQVLAGAPPGLDADAVLGEALGDRSPGVRVAAVTALGRRHAAAWRRAIRKRLDDTDEATEVRAAAAAALGGLCDADAADRLTELARRLGRPDDDPDAEPMGLAALVGLAALQPPDLDRRLAPLLAPTVPPPVRLAVEKALSARSACR
jgi:hypothetical protein